MPPPRPVVFVSHIHEDAAIAGCLKAFLDRAFAGVFDIFVSGDGASIKAGDNWSAKLESALTEASLVIALMSPAAMDRRWIYFECGGAYFARKRVIPVSCRTLKVPQLEPPLSWLQAVDGVQPAAVEQLIHTIATTHGLDTPECDCAELAAYLAGQPCARIGLGPAGAHTRPQRAFPLYLVVDTSSSMQGEPIAALTASIRGLLDGLTQSTDSTVTPFFSLISFGDSAQEVVPLTPLTSQSLKFELHAGGETSLGEALHLLASRLSDETQMPSHHLRPMIIVFTDGTPTDNWTAGLQALNACPLGQSARRVGVGIGDSYDRGVLEAIAADSVISVPTLHNIRGLSAFFKWVSASVSTGGDPTSAALGDLPPGA